MYSIISIFIQSIITILLILLFIWFYVYVTQFLAVKKIKGAIPIPLLGHVFHVQSPDDLLPYASKAISKYGSMFKLMLGFKVVVVIADNVLSQYILTSKEHTKKAREYEYFYDWLGHGLLTSDGKHYTDQRKLISPSFHFKILQHYYDIMNSCSDILVKKLEKEVGNDSTNIPELMALCSLDIVTEAAMGVKVNAQINEDSEYVRAVLEEALIVQRRILNPLKDTEIMFKFTRDYYKQRECLKVIHEKTESVIEERRNYFLINSKNYKEDDEIGIKRRMVFLDILLQSSMDGDPLTNLTIRDNVETFMFAGNHTTGSGISFTLYCLSKHPDVQRRIMEELYSIIGDDDNRQLTMNEIQDMKYLDMVIKESLRLFSPLPLVARSFKKDLEYEGYFIPKEVPILIVPMLIHRNPEYYPDPEKFDPERFLPENRTSSHPFSYVPFSAGIRNCIGQKFALIEMKVVVLKILRSYEIIEVKNYEPIVSLQISLKSSNGILVKFKKREKSTN